MDIGPVVRDLRRRHGLDQQSLARRAGTSQSQISRIERGASSPSISTVATIFRAAGEQLVVGGVAGPPGNVPVAELQASYRATTPGERVAEAAALSRLLTGIASDRAADVASDDWPVELRDLPPLQATELLTELNLCGVAFVVIGGFSLAAHGIVRGTRDLDVVPDPAPASLARLSDALGAIQAEPEPDADGLRSGGHWILKTAFGRLDVMQDVGGVASYAGLRSNAVAVSVPGVDGDVWFAGLDDLVSMKRAAGRDQDLIDVADLERARGRDAGP